MLLQGGREKIMCGNHRIVVVGKQVNSFTWGPGLDLWNLQPGWMYLLAAPSRKQMKVHLLLWSLNQWNRHRNIQSWRTQRGIEEVEAVLTKIGGLRWWWDASWLLVLSAWPCKLLGIFLNQKLIHFPVNEWGTILSHECWVTACPKGLEGNDYHFHEEKYWAYSVTHLWRYWWYSFAQLT